MSRIDRLTEGFKYATDIVLLLEAECCHATLKRLDEMEITGKRLENLWNKCLLEQDLYWFEETVYFLNLAILSKKDIMDNLDNDYPVPFILDIDVKASELEDIYDYYAAIFNNKYGRRCQGR